jgi:3-oxoacyl-[acyl-carrier protein] reductase
MGIVFRLDGRVAVITGAASGIGAATAQIYAEAGAAVVLGWYPGDPHDVRPVLDAVTALGGKAIAVEVDVSDASDVARLMRTAVDGLGGLDVVVANAGIARQVPTAELSDDEFHRLLDVDLVGVFRCFREAIPTMRAQGRGRLIATSSIAGAHYGWPDHVHYTSAKAGIVGLVRTLALDVARDGITVNAVAPGVVVTPQSSDPVNSLGPAGLETFADTVPVGRNGRPEDIAATFLYLASDEAAFLTGQTLIVDGGVSLQLV